MTTLWNKLFGKQLPMTEQEEKDYLTQGVRSKKVRTKLAESSAVLQALLTEQVPNKLGLYRSELEHKAELYEQAGCTIKAKNVRRLIDNYQEMTKPATKDDSFEIAKEWEQEAIMKGIELYLQYAPLATRLKDHYSDSGLGYNWLRTKQKAERIVDAELAHSPLRTGKYADTFKQIREKKIEEIEPRVAAEEKQEYDSIYLQIKDIASKAYIIRYEARQSLFHSAACGHGCEDCRYEDLLKQNSKRHSPAMGYLDDKVKDVILYKIQTDRQRQLTGDEYKYLDRAYRLSKRAQKEA